MTTSDKKRYPNPAGGEGAFLVLSDEGAKKLGLNPKDGTPHRRPGPAPVDVTNEGGAALVSSSTVAADVNAEPAAKPEGALEPGGPTSRARRKAEAEAVAAEAGPAPVEGAVEEGPVVEGATPEGEVVDDSTAADEAKPEDEAKPAARRRRASS